MHVLAMYPNLRVSRYYDLIAHTLQYAMGVAMYGCWDYIIVCL